ncbi:MAG: hypothetical protein K2M19_01215 [Muribaculaceae bacterium]|nr:hypothetical protein [Muribaculaceae bacterium]
MYLQSLNFSEPAALWFRSVAVTLGAWAWSVWGPALPVGAACTAMVLADVWSARRLARRLRGKRPTARQRLKFSSSRFGRTVRTLFRIYSLLAVAAVVEREVVGEWIHLTKFAAAVVCFWQAVSILENEASSNPDPWARAAGRWLVDKSSRYLKDDELPKF